MKLYGSLNARFDENKYYNGTYNNIKVGDYATEYMYTDQHAYEVVEVKDQKHVSIRRLKAIRTDKYGMSECQDYRYEQDTNNPILELELTQYGWKQVRYIDLDAWNKTLIIASKDIRKDCDDYSDKVLSLAKCYAHIDDKKLQKILDGKRVRVSSVKINISFGIADEYYDYSF